MKIQEYINGLNTNRVIEKTNDENMIFYRVIKLSKTQLNIETVGFTNKKQGIYDNDDYYTAFHGIELLFDLYYKDTLFSYSGKTQDYGWVKPLYILINNIETKLNYLNKLDYFELRHSQADYHRMLEIKSKIYEIFDKEYERVSQDGRPYYYITIYGDEIKLNYESYYLGFKNQTINKNNFKNKKDAEKVIKEIEKIIFEK